MWQSLSLECNHCQQETTHSRHGESLLVTHTRDCWWSCLYQRTLTFHFFLFFSDWGIQLRFLLKVTIRQVCSFHYTPLPNSYSVCILDIQHFHLIFSDWLSFSGCCSWDFTKVSDISDKGVIEHLSLFVVVTVHSGPGNHSCGFQWLSIQGFLAFSKCPSVSYCPISPSSPLSCGLGWWSTLEWVSGSRKRSSSIHPLLTNLQDKLLC